MIEALILMLQGFISQKLSTQLLQCHLAAQVSQGVRDCLKLVAQGLPGLQDCQMHAVLFF